MPLGQPAYRGAGPSLRGDARSGGSQSRYAIPVLEALPTVRWSGRVSCVSLAYLLSLSAGQCAGAAVPKVAGRHCFASPAGLGANLPLNRSNDARTDIVDIDGFLTGGQSVPTAWIYETAEHRLFVQYGTTSGKRSLRRALSAANAPQANWFAADSGSSPLVSYELHDGARVKSWLLRRNMLAICFASGPVQGL